jgi:glutamate racemase
MSLTNNPIGVFDSGVGGLSVLRAMRAQVPNEAVIYFGDQGHVPYGPRPLEQIQSFSEGITQFLLNQEAKIIVVACNTASAAALKYLRGKFPATSFVGMEPAIKPAAEHTATGVVGVLATPATFQGALYASVVERFGAGVELLQNTCPGLVQQIEAGDLDGMSTRMILENALFPMLERNIDTVVLGCTHYPFVIPLIEEIVGDKVRVIDPAPSVARQAKRLLEAQGMLNPSEARGDIRFYTSGDASTTMQSMLPMLLGEDGAVESVAWKSDKEIKGSCRCDAYFAGALPDEATPS